MSQVETRGHRRDCTPLTDTDISQALRRARIYLDAAAPRYAHEVLAPVLAESSEGNQGSAGDMEALTLWLEACLALGLTHECEERLADLEKACRHGHKGSVDVFVGAVSMLARLLIVRGRYAEALEWCRRVPAAVLERARHQAAVDLLARKQEALARLGDFEGAESVAVQIMERAEDAEDCSLLGNACGLMAWTFRMRGRNPEALRLYLKAARLHRRGGDWIGVARDHLNRGWLLNRVGAPREASAAFTEARRNARAASQSILELRADIGIAASAIRRGRIAPARRRLLATWRRARAMRLPREACLSLEFLGEALALGGRLGSARRALALCRRIAERIAPSGDLIVECGIRESLLALLEGRFDDAGRYACDAYRLAEVRGLAWEEAQGRRLAGVALAGLSDPEGAREELHAALERYRAMEERLEVRLVRDWLRFLNSRGRKAAEGGQLNGEWERFRPPLHPAEQRDPGMVPAPSTVEQECPACSTPPACDPPGQPDDPGSAGKPRARRRIRPVEPVWQRLGIVTRSRNLMALLEEAADLARSGAGVLIQGETGTGKDLVARGMHELSGRSGRFLPFNCAACPASLVESELFGVERGAYTGADRSRRGLVSEAAGGTLFLDEVGDLEPRGQGSVLRFLDAREVRSLGSTVIRRVSVGVMAATHYPLMERASQGLFRSDLYYRLAQGRLDLPPLRERREDLGLLVGHIWTRLAPDAEPPGWLTERPSMKLLEEYSWPGNVRELDHFLARLHLRLQADRACDAGPGMVRGLLSARSLPGMGPHLSPPGPGEVHRALAVTAGNRSRAAALLGISRAKLYRLLGAEGSV